MAELNTKTKIKITIDFCMSVAMLLLMAQALIGEKAHEWIGVGMFTLVIIHNILNLSWYRNLFKGKYSAFRIFQTILDVAIVLIMLGLMLSGIMMSRHVFTFLPSIGDISFARTLHMLSAYWGFTLMSFHVGLHVNMMMGMVKKATHISKPSKTRTIVLRAIAFLISAYGIYAFVHRQIGSYMFLLRQFVFFDFNEPLILFLLDYVAIMGLFICIGHYISGLLKKQKA